MKLAKVAVAIALLFLLVGSSPVFADSSHQKVALVLLGGILDSGTQKYTHQGGEAVAALVNGVPVDLKDAEFHQSLHAVITGLTVSGTATFSLTAKSEGGASVEVDGSAPINDMIPAELFPFACTPGVDCTSGIPGIFLGTAAVTIQTCQSEDQSQNGGDSSQNGGGQSQSGEDHSKSNCQKQSVSMPMQFESAFLNPFGGPIFISSFDQSLLIVATYAHARVTWAGIHMGGSVVGHLSGTPVSGSFAMVVSATEDLKKGHESDKGSIVFAGMSVAALNAAGTFSGESTIPHGIDCSGLFGFPPGTCQFTGFHSDGDFSQKNGSGGKITGEYLTEWSVPAVAFTSTVTATLK